MRKKRGALSQRRSLAPELARMAENDPFGAASVRIAGPPKAQRPMQPPAIRGHSNAGGGCTSADFCESCYPLLEPRAPDGMATVIADSLPYLAFHQSVVSHLNGTALSSFEEISPASSDSGSIATVRAPEPSLKLTFLRSTHSTVGLRTDSK